MTTYNTVEFLTSIKVLENKDLYFSGSEFSWADENDVDETYGDFICTYNDFVDAVNDYASGDNSAINKMLRMSGSDHETINKMVSNENISIDLEELDQ
jgi:hypothetical protein